MFYNFDLFNKQSSTRNMKNNNFMLILKQKSQQKYVWKKNKNQKGLKMNEKEADDNPVYRVLKNQRDTKTILDFIIQSNDIKKESRVKLRCKTQADEAPMPKASGQKYPRSQSMNQRQSLRLKAERIVFKTKNVGEQLQNSKKRVHILQRFNKRVDKYCSYLPESPDEEQNESAIANDQLFRLCNQNLFPTVDLYTRASQYVRYTQPKIPPYKLKKLKEKYRLNTTPSESNKELFTRLFTLNF